MKRWSWTIILLYAYSLSSGQLPQATVTIYGKGIRGPYSLGYRNLITNSVVVYKDSVELSAEYYTVQHTEGLVRFSEPVAINDSLLVSFGHVPISLKRQYYLHKYSETPTGFVSTVAPLERPSEFAGSDLTITGSKGFSIQTGAGGGGLSQSLNLSVSGDLVPGLRTSAHIFDKTTGASGVTRRLEELDKIYIEAESDHFRGVFGDFDHIERGDEFLSFQRKLTGLNAEYSRDNFEVKGSAAFFPGEYASMTIYGVDGRLGPYYLTDVGGREGAVILPASERVYLDGILQSRGSEQDYVIDYEGGAVQFSPSKVIRDETRITVDYEIARQEYSRSFYAVSGETEPAEGFRVFAKLIQEGDNKNSSKSFGMTSENKDLLEAAGDDRLQAARDGATFVGPGMGDYNLATDSLGISFYEYAGQDLGEYEVSFSFIGKNIASYRAVGGGVFEYVGAGSGDYEPVVLLPLPQVRRYGSAGVSWSLKDSTVTVEAELAGSAFDKNTLSDRDNLQEGAFGTVAAAYRRQLFGDDGYIGIDGRFRSIGSGSIFPGRIDVIERYRDYDLEPESQPEGERLQEIKIEGGRDDLRRIKLDLGFLSRPDIENRQRQAGEINWRFVKGIDWFARLERTQGERTWWKRSSGISAGYSIIQPSLKIENESRDGDSGFKYNEYIASVPATYFKNIAGRTDITFRDEKYLDEGWRDKFRSGSIQQKITLISGGSGFSGELAGSYYRKKYRDFAGTDTDQRSGWTRLSYSDRGGRGDFYISERLSSSNERLQARNYLFVGEGRGEYRFEDGEYIRDPDGDYVLLIEELGEGIKVTEISTEINGTLSPLTVLDPGRELELSIGRLVIETELTYRLKKSSNVLTGADFFPWKSSSLDKTVLRSGRSDLRFYYYPRTEKQRIKYAGTRSFQDGSPYANESISERFRSDEISWAFPAGKKVDILTSVFLSGKRSTINGVGYLIDRHRESAKVDFRFLEAWTLQLGPGFEVAKQTDIDLRSTILSGEIGLVRDFKNKGRISAKLSYFRVFVDPQGAYIPYQVASGKREGDNILANIRARMELSENGRLDFSYRYENFARRPEKHNLKMEVTILFL